jgi:hypothetical protein
MRKLNPSLNVSGNDVPIWEKYQQGGRTRPLDNDLMYKTLVEVSKVLNKHGMIWGVSHGTCLGLIRGDGHPSLDHDDDADIFLMFEQRHLLDGVYKDLEEIGFYCPPSDPSLPIDIKSNAPYYDMVAIHKEWGEKIEGWFYEKIGNERIYDPKRCGRDLAFPARFFENLGTIKFKDLELKIPSSVNEYLIRMYGNNWTVVDKKAKYRNQN